MCGIVMMSRLTDAGLEMLPFLGLEMQKRGTDSFGATNGYEIYKKAVSFVEGWQDFRDVVKKWIGLPLILHTRGASVGKVCDANAHPFEIHGSKYSLIGVHNGHISNHDELSKKYKERGFEVDSQHVLQHIADHEKTTEISGWGTVVWFNQTTMNLEMVRFNGGEWEMRSMKDGTIIGCSLGSPITAVAKLVGAPYEASTYTFETERIHFIQYDPKTSTDTLFKHTKMLFGGRAAYYKASSDGYQYHGYDYNNRTSSYDNELYEAFDLAMKQQICVKCYSTKLEKATDIICGSCLTEFCKDQNYFVKEARA